MWIEDGISYPHIFLFLLFLLLLQIMLHICSILHWYGISTQQLTSHPPIHPQAHTKHVYPNYTPSIHPFLTFLSA